MRTKLSVCLRKRRYANREEAEVAARAADIVLRPYRCDRCARFHLTGRTKGKRPLSNPPSSRT
jgi:hypothetical protein